MRCIKRYASCSSIDAFSERRGVSETSLSRAVAEYCSVAVHRDEPLKIISFTRAQWLTLLSLRAHDFLSLSKSHPSGDVYVVVI